MCVLETETLTLKNALLYLLNPQAGTELPIKLHLNMMREMDKCLDVMQKSFSEALELRDTPMPFPYVQVTEECDVLDCRM